MDTGLERGKESCSSHQPPQLSYTPLMSRTGLGVRATDNWGTMTPFQRDPQGQNAFCNNIVCPFYCVNICVDGVKAKVDEIAGTSTLNSAR